MNSAGKIPCLPKDIRIFLSRPRGDPIDPCADRPQNRYDLCRRVRSSMDRASVFGTEGCRFESCRAYFMERSSGGARPVRIATPENWPAGSSPAGRISWSGHHPAAGRKPAGWSRQSTPLPPPGLRPGLGGAMRITAPNYTARLEGGLTRATGRSPRNPRPRWRGFRTPSRGAQARGMVAPVDAAAAPVLAPSGWVEARPRKSCFPFWSIAVNLP